jgi:hypothetical protein
MKTATMGDKGEGLPRVDKDYALGRSGATQCGRERVTGLLLRDM